MPKHFKKWLSFILLGLFLTLAFSFPVLADSSWTLKGEATQSGSVITLTESSTSDVGGFIKTVPIDTRNGFTVSFDYCLSEGVSDYLGGPREGLQLVLSSQPIPLGDYSQLGFDDFIFNNISSHPYVNFYGLEIHKRNHIATVANSGTSRIHITTEQISSAEGVWYSIKAICSNQTLTVYRDGTLILTCDSFAPSDLSYIGFTAGTSYLARQKHQIRNVAVQSAEASLVKLDPNGGTCDSSEIYVLKNSSVTLPTPERTGYTFEGWYTLPSGGTKIKGTNDPFASVNKVYAHWIPNSYSVSFHANEGSCSQSSAAVTYGAAYGTLPVPRRTGYTFDGWFTAKTGGTKITRTSSVQTAGNHTLYAHWTLKTYKITFHPNKGKLAKSKKTRYVTYKTKIGSLPTPKRSGYTFLGWYTKKSGGKKIATTRVIKAKATYYAHWVSNSRKVTIRLNKNNGYCSKSSITVTYGGKLTGLPTASRSGCKFLGWYTKKSGGTKVTASTKTSRVIQTTKTLYAHWKKNSSGSSSSSGSSPSSGSNKYTPDCVFCGGDGDCSRCGGDGYTYSYALDDNDRINCTSCSATGKCFYCGGTGKRY